MGPIRHPDAVLKYEVPVVEVKITGYDQYGNLVTEKLEIIPVEPWPRWRCFMVRFFPNFSYRMGWAKFRIYKAMEIYVED